MTDRPAATALPGDPATAVLLSYGYTAKQIAAMSPSPGATLTLLSYGYTPKQIAAMSPAKRAAEVQNAVAAGVHVPDATAGAVVAPTAPVGAPIPVQLPRPEQPASKLGRNVFIAALTLAAGWWGYEYVQGPSVDRGAAPTCRTVAWDADADLASPQPQVKAVLRGSLRGACPTLTFACAQGLPSLEVGAGGVARPLAGIGPLVADEIRLNLPPLSVGADTVKITSPKQVELAAHVIHRAAMVRLELAFTDGNTAKASFFAIESERALNPILLACGLRPLPVAGASDDPGQNDDPNL